MIKHGKIKWILGRETKNARSEQKSDLSNQHFFLERKGRAGKCKIMLHSKILACTESHAKLILKPKPCILLAAHCIKQTN